MIIVSFSYLVIYSVLSISSAVSQYNFEIYTGNCFALQSTNILIHKLTDIHSVKSWWLTAQIAHLISIQ